ncbi:hypothetical protein [Acaryochloris sp. IP29b_bin.148]|nr:hypothetical protein [Acaryochloris sp. IP29b_bin.148]
MTTICDNTDQKELLRFWVRELTQLPPNKVDEIVMALNEDAPTLNPIA